MAELAPMRRKAATIDLAPLFAELQDQLGAETDAVERLIEAFLVEVRQLIMRFANPNVNVGSPIVNVDAPTVTVQPAAITLTPDISLNGLEGLAAQLDEIATLQRAMLSELAKPLVTSVSRDSEGRIVETTQRRQ
jgi:hypothetical protein